MKWLSVKRLGSYRKYSMLGGCTLCEEILQASGPSPTAFDCQIHGHIQTVLITFLKIDEENFKYTINGKFSALST